MPHGLLFGKFLRVLSFPHWRMILRHLFDAIAAQFVQARVSDMPDRGPALTDNGHRQNTGHTAPFPTRGRKPANLVIRVRDRFSYTVGSGSRLAFEPLSKHGERHIGRFSTGGLTAYAIHNDKNAARNVTMKSIFVNVSLGANIRLTGACECIDRSHGRTRHISVLILDFSPNIARYNGGETHDQQEP
jgi:hypothetical protein